MERGEEGEEFINDHFYDATEMWETVRVRENMAREKGRKITVDVGQESRSPSSRDIRRVPSHVLRLVEA